MPFTRRDRPDTTADSPDNPPDGAGDSRWWVIAHLPTGDQAINSYPLDWFSALSLKMDSESTTSGSHDAWELADGFSIVAAESRPYAQVVEAAHADAKKRLKAWVEANRETVDNVHKNKTMAFTRMPLGQFDSFYIPHVVVHKSKTYNKQQSSEYRVIALPDVGIVYARKSNHWGKFSTRSKTDMDPTDPLGRGLLVSHTWDLLGGDKVTRYTSSWDHSSGKPKEIKTPYQDYARTSQAGYILLAPLPAELTEAVRVKAKKVPPMTAERMGELRQRGFTYRINKGDDSAAMPVNGYPPLVRAWAKRDKVRLATYQKYWDVSREDAESTLERDRPGPGDRSKKAIKFWKEVFEYFDAMVKTRKRLEAR